MNEISRRQFVTLASGVAVAPFFVPADARSAELTAQEIVDRVRKALGVEWKAETVDTFKAGDPSTVVTGIVTTALPTSGVLRRSVAAGANLVVTSGPTFYSRSDDPAPTGGRGAAPARDAVFAAKRDLLERHKLVVWRFSDHWRLRRPNPLVQGLADVLGWSAPTTAGSTARVSVPEIGLDALATHVRNRLGAAGGVRVIGNPRLAVRSVGILPGVSSIQASLALLPAVDVIVAGEVREWESVEYVRDAVTAGQEKGLILVGRVVSEDPGMRLCVEWLRTIVPGVPATWIPAGDPYWRPA